MTMPGPHGEQRIVPALPVEAVKTYGFSSPADTSLPAACHDVGCEAHLHGWETVVDERTDLGMQQATYIRQGSGRTFREMRTDAGLTVFRFESGQRCFAEHRTRPERFFEYGGDWRGQTSPAVPHSAQGWVDAFGEHQQRVKEQIERG